MMRKNQFVIFLVMVLILGLVNEASASGLLGKDFKAAFWTFFFLIISGIIGYVVGTVKSFREEKQKAYGEILPPILKMVYHPQDETDEKEFGRALSKLWLYGNKKVTKKMDRAVSILHNHSRGNIGEALQEAVVEMRKDIQIWSWQMLETNDVKHLYTRIMKSVDTETEESVSASSEGSVSHRD